MRKRVRLTESDLHRIVKESVRRVLKEQNTPDFINKAIGYLCDYLSENGIDVTEMFNGDTTDIQKYGRFQSVVAAIYTLDDRL